VDCRHLAGAVEWRRDAAITACRETRQPQAGLPRDTAGAGGCWRPEDSGCGGWQIRVACGMRSERLHFGFWLPPLLWMVVIFSASGDVDSTYHSSTLFEPLMRWLFPWMAQARIEDLHFLFRKCAHLAEFGVLALLFWRAIRHSHGSEGCRWNWAQGGGALAMVALYAASDEFHQTFVPGRTGQLSDVLVDTAGGAAGLGLLWLTGKVFKHW
jgi:VanZ family protein